MPWGSTMRVYLIFISCPNQWGFIVNCTSRTICKICKIQNFSFIQMHLRMLSSKCLPLCSDFVISGVKANWYIGGITTTTRSTKKSRVILYGIYCICIVSGLYSLSGETFYHKISRNIKVTWHDIYNWSLWNTLPRRLSNFKYISVVFQQTIFWLGCTGNREMRDLDIGQNMNAIHW